MIFFKSFLRSFLVFGGLGIASFVLVFVFIALSEKFTNLVDRQYSCMGTPHRPALFGNYCLVFLISIFNYCKISFIPMMIISLWERVFPVAVLVAVVGAEITGFIFMYAYASDCAAKYGSHSVIYSLAALLFIYLMDFPVCGAIVVAGEEWGWYEITKAIIHLSLLVVMLVMNFHFAVKSRRYSSEY